MKRALKRQPKTGIAAYARAKSQNNIRRAADFLEKCLPWLPVKDFAKNRDVTDAANMTDVIPRPKVFAGNPAPFLLAICRHYRWVLHKFSAKRVRAALLDCVAVNRKTNFAILRDDIDAA